MLLAFVCQAQAQRVYPLVKISDIQTVKPDSLALCIDRPSLIGDTVRVQGIVLSPGGIAQSASGRQIWIRDIASQAGYNNLGIRFGGGNNPTTPTDLLNVTSGDTLEITGIVAEFIGTAGDGETQIAPLINGVRNIGDQTGPAPEATVLDNIGILNDAGRLNNLPTGEQWEGAFLEFKNVTVTTVTPFSAGTRVSFTVRDAAGNLIEVSDRFLAARPASGFIAPQVGDQFVSIKGINIHSKNRCVGSTGRGYTLNPFNANHYLKGASAPAIGGVTLIPAQPCSTSVTNIQATITDDGTIASARLIYGIGETGNFVIVNMVAGAGGIYSSAMPAQPDGTLIRYYLQATDNSGNVSNLPTNIQAPFFFTSRCSGPTIRDIQYTPYNTGNSGYVNRAVTNIEGIVSSSTFDLGQVYIQQQGATEWGGIWLTGGASIASLALGDKVRVSGNVQENFGMTRIAVTLVEKISSGNPVPVVELDPSVLSAYDFATNEKYESMLVRAKYTNNASLFVVDINLPSTTGQNVGQYRLGSSLLDPAAGVVVQAGNQGANNFSSLNVSYINNNRWATNLLAAPIVITPGQELAKSVTGVLYYGFNVLFVLPRTTADYELTATSNAKLAASQSFVLAGVPAQAGKVLTLLAKSGKVPAGLRAELVDAKGSVVALTVATQTESSLGLALPSVAPGLYTIRLENTASGRADVYRFVIQ